MMNAEFHAATARMNAPTAPMAPASVGVAMAVEMPGKPPMLPSTVKIRMAEGMMPRRHFFHSAQPPMALAERGTAGRYVGRKRLRKKV